MEVTVRKGEKEDVTAVYSLMMELAVYEKGEHLVTNTVEQMTEDGFGENPVYGLLVAESLTPDPSLPIKIGTGVERGEKKEIIGMAIYYTKYSTWKGRGLFLEDLVVNEKHRKKGIGKKLFDAVLAEARTMNAQTMHWQVLDWNTPAIKFYEKYNCSFEKAWIDCKLTAKQF